jgi:hypothetical protein
LLPPVCFVIITSESEVKNVIKPLFVKYSKLDSTEQQYFFINAPIQCPICHSYISPNHICDNYNFEKDLLSTFWECTSCYKTFLSYCSNPSTSKEMPSHCDLYPKFPKQVKFDDSINQISDNFQNIFNQASKAESDGLNEICGIGYRKALEFLIKDYCIYRNPDDKEKIKSIFLGQVIEKYIDSPKIKNLAKVSTWLGNDETHYVRKFTDKDINDLKKFINATVHFITYELLSDEADNIVSSK